MIDEYLGELRVSLRLPTKDRDRILAEAEDHLRESVVAGLAAGLTRVESEEAAISAFGSVRAVVRAHRRGRDRLVDAVLTVWKLGAVALLGVGASGVVAAFLNRTAGRSFVGGAPAGSRFNAADCRYWQAAWHVSSCARAAMLESSSDAVSLRILAGIAGLVALAGYLVVRRLGRSRRRLFPALAAGFFGLATVTLVVLTGFHGRVPFLVPTGPGAYLSGAIVTAALAAGYGAVAWRRRDSPRALLARLSSL
jgi:hypothetical protein